VFLPAAPRPGRCRDALVLGGAVREESSALAGSRKDEDVVSELIERHSRTLSMLIIGSVEARLARAPPTS
jgi:hypothetical protein